MNAPANVVCEPGAGAGEGNESGAPPGSTSVGLYVLEPIAPEAGNEPPLSENTRLAFEAKVNEVWSPMSDISISVAPPGATSIASTSPATECENEGKAAVTFVTEPDRPDTLIDEGYGDAMPDWSGLDPDGIAIVAGVREGHRAVRGCCGRHGHGGGNGERARGQNDEEGTRRPCHVDIPRLPDRTRIMMHPDIRRANPKRNFSRCRDSAEGLQFASLGRLCNGGGLLCR